MVMSNCQHLGATHKDWASLVPQMIKNPPAMQETWVQSLGWEDPGRREQQPTPVFWPGEFRGQRSLVGYSLWGHKELDTTEWLSLLTHKHSQENTLNKRVVMCNTCPSLAALSAQGTINWLPGLSLSCLKKMFLFYFDCAGSWLLCGLSLVATSWGYSRIAVLGLLIEVVSLVAEHGL